MPVFDYKEFDRQAKTVLGNIDADSSQAARRELQVQRLFPITIVLSRDIQVRQPRGRLGNFTIFTRVRPAEIGMMTRQLVQDIEDGDLETLADIEVTADLLDETSEAPIIRLVNQVISQSAKARASDIHIEPGREHIKIRYRIDGILYDLLTPIAQMLLRVLCPDCRVPGTYPETILRRIGLTPDAAARQKIFKPVGCGRCVQTGYRGRIGIFEFMPLDEDLKNLVLESFSAAAVKAQAIGGGMITLQQDANRKVLAGRTSVDEAFRVTH